jgi:hypothetical protein
MTLNTRLYAIARILFPLLLEFSATEAEPLEREILVYSRSPLSSQLAGPMPHRGPKTRAAYVIAGLAVFNGEAD